ncbi:hypothetical protein PINS_up000191 [Pythium insidiosum]|nr:hypothetical protein PINS_up000191 [Pythium insidiosum]
MASESGFLTALPDASAKERQQALYTAVCEPVIRRGLFLLKLNAAPVATSSGPASPLKLLPGISVATVYGAIELLCVFPFHANLKSNLLYC